MKTQNTVTNWLAEKGFKNTGGYYPIEEIAKILGCTGALVRQQIASGKMPGKKILGSWRVNSRDFIQWFISRECPDRAERFEREKKAALYELINSEEYLNAAPGDKWILEHSTIKNVQDQHFPEIVQLMAFSE